MRWHSTGLNGWHEDFHTTVAIADTAFVLMAYCFLAEASRVCSLCCWSNVTQEHDRLSLLRVCT